MGRDNEDCFLWFHSTVANSLVPTRSSCLPQAVAWHNSFVGSAYNIIVSTSMCG